MEAPGVGEVSAERRDSTTAETTHIPRTWQLFLLLVCAALALSWYQRDFIMTREVYHHLFGDRVGAERIDDHFDQLRQRVNGGSRACRCSWASGSVLLPSWSSSTHSSFSRNCACPCCSGPRVGPTLPCCT